MAASKSEKTRRANKKSNSNYKRLGELLSAQKTAGEVDYAFLFMVILVLIVGLVMLLSVSAPASSEMYEGKSYWIFLKQLLFTTLGLAVMWVCSRIPYESYKQWTEWIYVNSVVLLILVMIFGREVNGSKRWLSFFQPSELAKPAVVLMAAKYIAMENTDMAKLRIGWVKKYVLIFGLVALFLMMEPHLSATMIIFTMMVTMLCVNGMKLWPVIVMGVPAAGAVGVWIKHRSANRWSRLMRFLSPFEDLQNSGYQISQSLYSIGSGKLFGLGLGESVQKYGFLPEPYNDFIFAIICEELGFVGATMIVILFVALILFGMRIAMNAPDTYSTMLATGIVTQLAMQTLMNIAVATASFPNTGVSLPFFSYGGTSVVTLLAEMGILLNISRYSKRA